MDGSQQNEKLYLFRLIWIERNHNAANRIPVWRIASDSCATRHTILSQDKIRWRVFYCQTCSHSHKAQATGNTTINEQFNETEAVFSCVGIKIRGRTPFRVTKIDLACVAKHSSLSTHQTPTAHDTINQDSNFDGLQCRRQYLFYLYVHVFGAATACVRKHTPHRVYKYLRLGASKFETQQCVSKGKNPTATSDDWQQHLGFAATNVATWSGGRVNYIYSIFITEICANSWTTKVEILSVGPLFAPNCGKWRWLVAICAT